MKNLWGLLLIMMLCTLTACGGQKEDTQTDRDVLKEDFEEGDNFTDTEDEEYVEDIESEEENDEENGIPQGWEVADMPYLPEGLTVYFNPEILRYSGADVFANVKGVDNIVTSLDFLTDTTPDVYMAERKTACEEDTMNPKQNVVLSEIKSSVCAGYTVYSATISYDLKQYDMGDNFDKGHEYTPEEMEQFPVIWVPQSSNYELVEIAEGVYLKIRVTIGDLETILGALKFEYVK